jgi:hypothetical protein
MGKYNIKLLKLSCSLLPNVLRTYGIKSIIKVFLSPLNGILTMFQSYIKDKEKQLSFSSQVFSLERMIEYYAGFGNGEIAITDGEIIEGLYFYRTEEQKPVYFPTVYFSDSATWTTGGFIVHCPVGADDKLDKIKYLLNRYKFAGTQYKIVFDKQ